ncbi:hypothetical protein [Halomonas borealis]|nr:hypothetical protein [Halomonas borealis]
MRESEEGREKMEAEARVDHVGNAEGLVASSGGEAAFFPLQPY